MFIFYDLIFFLAVLFYLPVYIFARKFHSGFKMRLGFLPKNLSLHRPIWIHAVSVGEVMAIKGLLEELRRAYPDKQIVISTVTATGNKVARAIAKESDFITYLPLDFSFIVRRVITRISPSLFIIAETELWPNLISCLYKKNIPIVTVNGRVSDASFFGYLSGKIFILPILRKVSLFCVQAERDAGRLMRLGVTKERIRVTGNMKFDASGYLEKEKPDIGLRSRMGLGPQNKLLVAGSTHPGEEEMILSVYRQIIQEFPNLLLLIAPRHPQRSKEAGAWVSKFGFSSVFVSGMPDKFPCVGSKAVFILDTVGELPSFYALADIVFVGGSLVRKGGHNILEPAVLGRPVLFGPHMFNFRDIAELFLKNNAAIMIHSPQELLGQIKLFLREPEQISGFCAAAQKLIAQNRGATLRNLGYLKEFLRE